MPFLPPNQQRQSTEGNNKQTYATENIHLALLCCTNGEYDITNSTNQKCDRKKNIEVFNLCDDWMFMIRCDAEHIACAEDLTV